MKFLNAIIFSILICNIFSEEENKDDAYTTFEKACNGEQYHIINYDKTDRVLELDWTDDDSFTLNVEFYSIGEKGIIGEVRVCFMLTLMKTRTAKLLRLSCTLLLYF